MSDIRSVSLENAVAVTQSDSTTDPSGPFAGIYTGSGGNIKVTTLAGNSVVFQSALAGTVIYIQISRVWSTGTAAAGVLGLKARPVASPT